MNIKKIILDSIYPRCCPVCHEVVKSKGELICGKCLEKLSPIAQPRCMKCGKSLNNPHQEYCSDCVRADHCYDQGMGIYPYDERMRGSIEGFKFHGRREYGDFYVQAMAHYAGAQIVRWQPDCIIPVPMHPKKLRLRGRNPAEDLASGLAQHMGLPMDNTSVLRVGQGREQKELSARQRRRNLSKAFLVCEESLPYNSVLLVDDVYTTGSTIDAVAGVLKRAGVKSVYFVTVCQGKGF